MNTNQKTQIDIWEKWDWLWQAIFYLTVIISLGLASSDKDLALPIWAVVLLAVILLLWHWLGMKFAYRNLIAWEKYPTPRFVVLLGDMIFWFILVMISPSYYIMLLGMFIQVFRHLPVRYSTIAVLILTALMITEQMLDAGESISLSNINNWLFLFGVLASVIISVWISAIIDQSIQRRELIDKLEATQAELVSAERREGVLEERQRLAHDIHDTLAQGFTSIVMHLEAAEQALPDDLTILQKHLNQARSTARNSLDEARRVVQDLRPNLLEQQSLSGAIERTTQRWQDETGIPVTAQTTGYSIPLPSNIEVTLLRSVQESLNNIHKHAGATDVRVTLSYMGNMIILDIQDNGVGIDGAEPSRFKGGYGLRAMRERVSACGGSVELESDIGEGTTVVITIPLLDS